MENLYVYILLIFVIYFIYYHMQTGKVLFICTVIYFVYYSADQIPSELL
jgi:hypothetical protein